MFQSIANTPIQTKLQAAIFLAQAIDIAGNVFHPDTSFCEYTDSDHKPIYTDEQSDILDQRMTEVFTVFGANENDEELYHWVNELLVLGEHEPARVEQEAQKCRLPISMIPETYLDDRMIYIQSISKK
jgi:hypothetical protein